MQDDAGALVTNTADLPLSLVFADCVPVALYDPAASLAVCHAGWRGTVKGAAASALAAMMATYGTTPQMSSSGSGRASDRIAEVGDEVVAVAAKSYRHGDIWILAAARRKPYFACGRPMPGS